MDYTKGEWRLVQDDTSTDTIIMTDNCTIGRVFSSGADAQLIASAPDLYEACLSALGVMATLDQNKGWVKEISGVIQQALAKAKGKE